MYAQGRSKPGPKVTNAQAGYSWHNFGVGWDFVVFDAKGQPLWDSPLMERCGKSRNRSALNGAAVGRVPGHPAYSTQTRLHPGRRPRNA